jgi:hypothetical protein
MWAMMQKFRSSDASVDPGGGAAGRGNGATFVEGGVHQGNGREPT